MKQRLTHVLCLLLAVAVVATCGCGCQQSGGSGGNKVSAEGLPTLDFGGHNTVKLLHTAEPGEETVSFLKEKYGLTVETTLVPWEDVTVRFATLVLSDDAPDALYYRSDQIDYPNYIVNNLVQPVNEYIDLSDPFYADVRGLYDEIKWGDKNYVLVSGFGSSTCMFYNTKLIEDAGLESPWELYKRNEWDWDKMREYALELTEDSDRDGTPNVYGLAVNRPFPMSYSTGKAWGQFDGINKKFVHNCQDTDIARAMTFLSNLVVKDKVCPTVINNVLEMFGKGEVAMTFGEPFYTDPSIVSLAQDGNLGICPMARDPKVDKYYVRGQMGAIWIPDGAANPQGAVALYVSSLYEKKQPDYYEEFDKKLREECHFSEENIQQAAVIRDPTKCIPVKELAPWADPGSWTMVGNGSTWEVELSKGLPLIEARIGEIFTPTEVDLPSSPKTVDNFEDYKEAASEKLGKYFPVSGGSGNLNMFLDASDHKEGKFSGKLTYDVSDAGWGGLQYTINKTWENNNALRFWMKGDGSAQTVQLQFNTQNGGMWQHTLNVNSKDWQKYEIPFTDFTIPDGGLDVDLNLKKVTSLYISVAQPKGAVGTHTLNFDGVEAYAQ